MLAKHKFVCRTFIQEYDTCGMLYRNAVRAYTSASVDIMLAVYCEEHINQRIEQLQNTGLVIQFHEINDKLIYFTYSSNTSLNRRFLSSGLLSFVTYPTFK